MFNLTVSYNSDSVDNRNHITRHILLWIVGKPVS